MPSDRTPGLLVPLLAATIWAGCAPPPGPVPLPPPPEGEVRLWVVVAGRHTGLVLEQPEGWALGPPGHARAPYVEVAWGDRRWYMEGQRSTVLATLFWPTDSVVRVRARTAPPHPAEGFRAVYERTLPGEAFHALARAVEATFARTDDGRRAAPHPPRAADPAERFYPGRPPYVIWDNSNTWTVRVLRAADAVRDGPLPVVFAAQVALRLEGFAPVTDTTRHFPVSSTPRSE